MAEFGDGSAEEEFLAEDAETIVKNALQTTLSEVQYDAEKVGVWSNAVIDACLKGLQGLAKPFKYVVTCIIMQKNGAGLHSSVAAFWDSKKDGICKVPWENMTMHCIVTVFGVAIGPSPQPSAAM